MAVLERRINRSRTDCRCQ